MALNFPRIIKEVGRGTHGSRELSGADAETLFGAMLEGKVPELELGALLIAYRIKGESAAELQGFMGALAAHTLALEAPPGVLPVLLPSYNGARKLPNLTPLLAMLLAREGVPVLVHGPSQAHGRVTSAALFAELGIPICENGDAIAKSLAADRLVYAPVSALSPGLDRLLAMRARLGVRSSAHTLAKLIDPFSGKALRVVPVTHPDYLKRMREFLSAAGTPAMLLRGSEGEPVAGPRRALAMECYHDGASVSLASAEFSPEAALPASIEAGETVRWIRAALAGEVPIPQTLLRQCAWTAAAARGEWSALDSQDGSRKSTTLA